MELNTRKRENCPGCGSLFTPLAKRAPLLLPSCGHHLCGTCVAMATPSGQVTCSTTSCGLTTNIPAVASVQLQFPVDFHLLGVLAFYQCQSADDPPPVPLQDQLATFDQPKCIGCAARLQDSRQSLCKDCVLRPPPDQGQSLALRQPDLKVCGEHGRSLEFVDSESLVPGCTQCFLVGDLKKGQKIEDLEEVEQTLPVQCVLQKLVKEGEEVLEDLENNRKTVLSQDTRFVSVKHSVAVHLTRCQVELALLGSRVMLQLSEQEREQMVERGKVEQELGERIYRLRRVLRASEEGSGYSAVLLVQELRDLLGHMGMQVLSEVEVREEVDLSLLELIRKYVILKINKRVPEPSVMKHIKDGQGVDHNCNYQADTESYSRDDKSAGHQMKDFDLVKLSFVESSESFYVQRVEDLSLINWVRKEVQRKRKGAVGINDNIMCGTVAVVGSDRVRVEMVEEDLVEVFLMDQGERKTVDRKLLRNLSGHLSTMPALAHHCSLSDLESPLDGRSVSDCFKIKEAMLHYAAGTHCRVKLNGITSYSSKLLVELTKQQSMEVSEYIPSMFEYLQYLGLVNLTGEVYRGEQRSFIPPSVFSAGDTETVLVSHVTNPHLLWVNRGGSYAQAQVRQQGNLDKVYKERWGEEDLRVMVPRVGQVCVARYSGDRGVYRARVMQLLGEGVVKVQFVDFGNTEEKQSGELRQLLNQFLAVAELAVPVRLSDVVPLQGDDWGAKSCSLLMERVRGRELTLHMVEGGVDGLSRVMLYEVLPNKNISLNGWLISQGLAVSDTGMANTVDYFKVPSDTVPVGRKTECDFSVSAGDNEVLMTEVEEDEVESDQEYQVLSVVSPALMILRKLKDAESFYKFSSELSAHFISGSSVPSTLGQAVLGSCWVSRLPGEGWVRVRLLDKGDTEAELELLDYGRNVKVPEETKLHPLSKKFKRKRFSLTVHLSGVVPAGGSSKWTMAACRKLASLLPGPESSVRLTVEGRPTTSRLGLRSWPVSLVYKAGTGGGPLEPQTVEEVNLGDTLMEDGLAIPARLSTEKSTEATNNIRSVTKLDNRSVLLPTDLDLTKDPSLLPLSIYSSIPVDNIHLPTSNCPSSSSWTSPRPPPSPEFTCTCTYVDWDCNLHVSLSDNQDNLLVIRTILNSKYSTSSPRPTDMYWTAGQDCVARYNLDGMWYRGKVLKVNMATEVCEVKFVDYGTEDFCNFAEMRKDFISVKAFPIQCFTIRMLDVEPRDGMRWQKRELDFLHEVVVEQELRVKVRLVESGIFPLTAVSITTKAGINIDDLFVNNGFARRIVKSKHS